MVDLLLAQREEVIVLDDLMRGHRGALDESVPFYQGETGDQALVQRICHEHEIESCIHFAALACVGESVAQPKLYLEKNVEHGIALLDSLMAAGVRRFVFSSTCATDGELKAAQRESGSRDINLGAHRARSRETVARVQ